MVGFQIVDNIKLIDRNQWSDFVNHHPNGNVFQTAEFFEVYSKSELFEPILLFALKRKIICGVLLAIVQKEYKGVLGKFTSRSIILGGPLVYDPDLAYFLLFEYNKIVNQKAIFSQFRNIFNIDSFRISFTRAGYNFEEHLDILLDLTKGEEKLWTEIHKNRKKEIKNGLKKGLKVNTIVICNSTVLPELYQMLKFLYNKIGLPVPSINFFIEAINTLEPKGFLKTFIAKVDQKIVGFRMVLTFNNLIYDWYAASDEEYLNYRPNDVLPWEILKWGIKNSYNTFDFGGAGKPNKQYGVRDYKLKFGGDLVNFGRYEKIHKPLLFEIGKLGLKFWKLMK